MLRWPLRLVTVLAAAALAYGWGDFATDPDPLSAVALLALTGLLVAALSQLYRSGGLAAFAFDEELRRAPGDHVSATAVPAASRGPTARPAAPRPSPSPARPVAPPSRRAGGSLWSSDPPAPASSARVDLNAAGVAELSPLPGVGRVWAQRIVEDRAARGPFATVEDLARIEGFNPAKLAALEGRLRA